MKVEFAKQRFGSTDQLNVPELQQMMPQTTNLQNRGQAPHNPLSAQQPAPVQPEIQLSQLDDRAIATSYLLTLKRAGREYAWATFETSTPQLRSFLEDAFRMCSHQAFEVWQWMVQQGWYPAVMAPQQAVQTLASSYREVPYHQPADAYQEGGKPYINRYQ